MLAYLNKRSPTAAVKLDVDIERCIGRLAAREFDGPVSQLNSGTPVRSWAFSGIAAVEVYLAATLIARGYRRPATRSRHRSMSGVRSSD